MLENHKDNIKSTIDLIDENDKIDINKNKKENGNIDINRNYEEEPINKKKNIDINAEPTTYEKNSIKTAYKSLDENVEESINYTPSSNEKKILNICEDINNKIKKFQMIPLYIQKGSDKKFLLVKKGMTLKDILFINFKEDNVGKKNFYIGKNLVNENETIEQQNIAPLSLITDYQV